MSRWIDNYKNHAYAASWHSFMETLENVKLVDETDLASAQELGRLRKATLFIDSLIKNIEPELVHLGIWDNFLNQSNAAKQRLDQFLADKNIGHIHQVNTHIDNLLNSIRPYMVADGGAAKAIQEASISASEQINEHFRLLKEDAENTIETLEGHSKSAESLLSKTKSTHEKIVQFELDTFGDDVTDGSDKKLNKLISEADHCYKRINEYHNEIFTGNEEALSIRQQVASGIEQVEKDKDSINSLVSATKDKVDNLSEFHVKIFGGNEGGNEVKGLEEELDLRKSQLNDFEKEQKKQYKALNDEINSLLPGATSAGLASAYHDMKTSFEKPIRNSSLLFYIAIGILIISSLLLTIESIGGGNGIKFSELKDWDSIIKSFVYKLPFYAPILWLALYASKRRSECQRLQQEYAHKEALAKSYHSYKQQIEALNSDDENMLKSLMLKAIDAIAYNASDTLDKRHGDKLPLHEAIDKLISHVNLRTNN